LVPNLHAYAEAELVMPAGVENDCWPPSAEQ
jgi:hypothetical protein